MQKFANDLRLVLSLNQAVDGLSLTQDEVDFLRESMPALGADDFAILTISFIGLKSEIIKLISVGQKLIGVERAQEGTVAIEWPSGSSLELFLTAGTVSNFAHKSEILALNHRVDQANDKILALEQAISGIQSQVDTLVSPVSLDFASILTGGGSVLVSGGDVVHDGSEGTGMLKSILTGGGDVLVSGGDVLHDGSEGTEILSQIVTASGRVLVSGGYVVV